MTTGTGVWRSGAAACDGHAGGADPHAPSTQGSQYTQRARVSGNYYFSIQFLRKLRDQSPALVTVGVLSVVLTFQPPIHSPHASCFSSASAAAILSSWPLPFVRRGTCRWWALDPLSLGRLHQKSLDGDTASTRTDPANHCAVLARSFSFSLFTPALFASSSYS